MLWPYTYAFEWMKFFDDCLLEWDEKLLEKLSTTRILLFFRVRSGRRRSNYILYILLVLYYLYYWIYFKSTKRKKMSAAAGIGALSISTIEGTYRGNETTNLYIFIDYYIILYFCQKKKQWKHQVLIYKSLILRNPFDRWPITSWLHKEKKTVERYIQLPTYPLPHHQHLELKKLLVRKKIQDLYLDMKIL